jgi:hypothetical protein
VIVFVLRWESLKPQPFSAGENFRMRIHCFGRWSLTHLLAISLGFAAHAQTPASTTLGGGTFNWNWTLISRGSCPVGGNYQNMKPVFAYQYSDFNATVNGIYKYFGGSFIGYIVSPGAPPFCPQSGATRDITLVADNYAVDFSPQNYGQGTAVQYNRGKFDPAYMVQSIIYAPPGNRSGNSFTNSTTDGTSTSFGASFTLGSTVTVGEGFSFAGIGGTMAWITGESQTQGYSIASTNTITNAASVGLQSPGAATP